MTLKSMGGKGATQAAGDQGSMQDVPSHVLAA